MKYILSQAELDKLQQADSLETIKQITNQRDELVSMILNAETAQIVEDPLMMEKKILIGIDPKTMPKHLQELLNKRMLSERKPGSPRL